MVTCSQGLLNDLSFPSLDFVRACWRLFQKRVVRTKFDIYMHVFIKQWWWTIPPISTICTSHHRTQKRSRHVALNTHDMAWDRNNNEAGLNAYGIISFAVYWTFCAFVSMSELLLFNFNFQPYHGETCYISRENACFVQSQHIVIKHIS